MITWRSLRIALLTFSLLMWRDVRAFLRQIHWYLFDSLLVSVAHVMVQGYMLPLLGLSPEYGGFIMVGSLVTVAWVNASNEGIVLVNDLASGRCINYELTLPMPSSWVFIHRALNFSVHTALLNMPVIPLVKLFLGDRLDLSQLSLIKWVLAYGAIHLFIGAIVLWLASMVKNPFRFRGVGRRLIVPLLTVAPERYPWMLLAVTYPDIARWTLLNPFVYAFEMLRAAAFGQQGYLNFWICLVVLSFISLICCYHALRRFKQRVDFC